jgi:hypothetical protein
MTHAERMHVMKALVYLAELYGKQFSRESFVMMADSLMDLDGTAVLKALQAYTQEPSSRTFPMPGQIRALVNPTVSTEQQAIEAGNKIVEAMTKFGWTNPEKAKEFMGPIAWGVVQREGGWAQLCERTNNDDLPILKAQWRELAKVVAIRQKQEENLALSAPDTKKIEATP